MDLFGLKLIFIIVFVFVPLEAIFLAAKSGSLGLTPGCGRSRDDD